jgi:hypothetical protein
MSNWANDVTDSLLAKFKDASQSDSVQKIASVSPHAQSPQARPTSANSAQSKPQSQTLGAANPAKQVFDRVVAANRPSIESVLAVAATGDKGEIESVAQKAGRSFDFSSVTLPRDRKLARQLNAQALDIVKAANSMDKAFETQLKAFSADALDLEVAGNLAIYAYQTGRNAYAMDLSIYALSLPRADMKTGRTADWATLAATYATTGNQRNAASALYVTLAIAPDVTKRCYSAVYSAKNTYGPALQPATERLLERIRDKGLSYAQECSLPIAW